MDKLIKKYIITVLIAVIVICSGLLTTLLTFNNHEIEIQQEPPKNIPVKQAFSIENKEGYTYVNGLIVVNKKYSIPKEHAQIEDATAQLKLKQLISKMIELNFDVNEDYGGIRSYDTQTAMYEKAKQMYGEQVDLYEAKAGYSERETGFTFDLYDTQDNILNDSKALEWLNTHAYEYGFILRLPIGKEHITGFYGKPNRIRYVGDIAKDIFNSGKTFEEYFNLDYGEYQQ